MHYEYEDETPPKSLKEIKQKSRQIIAKLNQDDGKNLTPVIVSSRIKISTSFWGQAWCRAIESYKDLDYRLERGRSYVRAGAVVDLKISHTKVKALVNGSELYRVEINFKPLCTEKWENFAAKCSKEIDSLVDLLSGKLPQKVIEMITDSKEGLFPKSNEIDFSCNCLDYADVCKHVAACLYGIGVHFDSNANLFFHLRGVDPNELISHAKESLAKEINTSIDHKQMSQLFDIEFDS